MGIPLLFGYLARKYNRTELIQNYDETEIVDNLYLDYNGLIHGVINDYNSDETEIITEARLNQDVFKETINMINLVRPRKRVYIGIDGVAPRAKMNQQRMRRFKSAMSTSETRFDRNKVTPGTEFMENLSSYLHQKFKEIKGIEVIFSDVNEEGEGEHKILQFMRDNFDDLKEETHIIHGLDCDLVMLSMSMELKIKLIRENNKNTGYVIFDIEEMKQIVYLEISEQVRFPLNKQRVIQDFIVICFLIGNDFLVNLPTLKIKKNGVQVLLVNYTKLFRFKVLNSNRYIVNEDKSINMKGLRKYIEFIGSSEMYFFNRNGIDPVEHKKEYYKTYLKTEDEKYISDIGVKYIEGIQWVAQYYFCGVRDWKWFYPYYYSIFASDMTKFDWKKFESNKPYKPSEQLVSVLPLKSLPQKYRDKVTPDIMYMFPDTFEIDNRDTQIPEHARNALIPFVDDTLLFDCLLK